VTRYAPAIQAIHDRLRSEGQGNSWVAFIAPDLEGSVAFDTVLHVAIAVDGYIRVAEAVQWIVTDALGPGQTLLVKEEK
jgi:hypothetical protein